MTGPRGSQRWEGQPVKVSYPGGASPPSQSWFCLITRGADWSGYIVRTSIAEGLDLLTLYGAFSLDLSTRLDIDGTR